MAQQNGAADEGGHDKHHHRTRSTAQTPCPTGSRRLHNTSTRRQRAKSSAARLGSATLLGNAARLGSATTARLSRCRSGLRLLRG